MIRHDVYARQPAIQNTHNCTHSQPNLLFAGLSALPLGILTASGTLVPLLHNSSTRQEEILELPKPAWWTSDIHEQSASLFFPFLLRSVTQGALTCRGFEFAANFGSFCNFFVIFLQFSYNFLYLLCYTTRCIG